MNLVEPENPADKPSDGPEHIIVLIHGIRTHASWAEMVKAVLEPACSAEVIPLRYGYFDVFRFLCPLFTREAPVRRIVRELRDIRAAHPTANISVIAHSFGTYTIRRALVEREIRLHRLILCGCIIKEGFRRADYGAQLGADPIVNDCGTHDIWPVMARSITWGYGATGTFGFGTNGVRDRYSKFTHTEFFNRAFIEEYWIPFLKNGEIRGTEWEQTRTPPWWQWLLSWLPIKYLLLAIIGVLGFLYWQDREGKKQLVLDIGPDIIVGHIIGVPWIQTPVHVHNETSREVAAKNLNLKLIAPSGGITELPVEAIWMFGQMNQPLRAIVMKPRDRVTLDHSFFRMSTDYQMLMEEASAYTIRQGTIVNMAAPDESKEYLSQDLAERHQVLAKRYFIWVPGTWKARLEAEGLDGKPYFVEKQFDLSEDEVKRMWAITAHYKSGIGVFPMWRGLAKGDYQPMVPKKLHR